MKRKRIGALLLALALLCSGCAGGAKTGNDVITITDDKVTIQILAGQSTSDAGSENMIGAVLEEKFPDVEFDWVCVDWGDNFASLVSSRYAAGVIPDILIGKAQDVAVYQQMGAIAPLSAEICASVAPEQQALITIDGQLYGLPYNSAWQGVVYNKAIFDQLGLSVPRTRQELADTAAACEQAGITPFATHFSESWAVGNNNMQFMVNDLFCRAPQWGDDFRAHKENFTGNATIENCLLQNQFLLEHSWDDALQINQHEADSRFAKGEAAMYLTGTWTLQTLGQMSPELEVGIFPYPNQTGDAQLITETNMTFMKGNGTENSELVDAILLELGSNETLAREISEFTHEASTFTALSGTAGGSVQLQADEYAQTGQVINVNIGNTQLVWPFQNAVAEQCLLWLAGKQDLNQVLAYADNKRMASA